MAPRSPRFRSVCVRSAGKRSDVARPVAVAVARSHAPAVPRRGILLQCAGIGTASRSSVSRLASFSKTGWRGGRLEGEGCGLQIVSKKSNGMLSGRSLGVAGPVRNVTILAAPKFAYPWSVLKMCTTAFLQRIFQKSNGMLSERPPGVAGLQRVCTPCQTHTWLPRSLRTRSQF